MQSRSEVARRNILRAATSTPSKVAGLSAAVAVVVYVSGPSWNDPGEIIGALANACEVVLFPYGAYQLSKRKSQD